MTPCKGMTVRETLARIVKFSAAWQTSISLMSGGKMIEAQRDLKVGSGSLRRSWMPGAPMDSTTGVDGLVSCFIDSLFGAD